jgi:DmsE family decaheme c-type cytochrome
MRIRGQIGLATAVALGLAAGSVGFAAPTKASEFAHSRHAAAGLSCGSCHLPASAGEAVGALKEKQAGLCGSCHAEEAAAAGLPSRHAEGDKKLECSDCHDVHGAAAASRGEAVAAQNQSCLRCHSGLAGPFSHEHPAVKEQGCVGCHAPHGSKDAALLIRANVNQICMFCHAMASNFTQPGVAAFHNQTKSPQVCTSCHAEIHGSNTSKLFLK